MSGINISAFTSRGGVYANCECIKGFAFKNAALWVECALLPVICTGFGFSQDSYAHFCRMGYPSPHNNCA